MTKRTKAPEGSSSNKPPPVNPTPRQICDKNTPHSQRGCPEPLPEPEPEPEPAASERVGLWAGAQLLGLTS